MLTQGPKKAHVKAAQIGEIAAMQPLSGILRVEETYAVNGLGRGAYVRKEETENKKPSAKAR